MNDDDCVIVEHCALLESAFGIIANAHGGNWDQADPIWRRAAERWRDHGHILLREHCTSGTPDEPLELTCPGEAEGGDPR